MTRISYRWSDFILSIGLVIALVLSSWSFMQSEQYRKETDVILTQAFEIQWRSSQIKEKLSNVTKYIKSSIIVGNEDSNLTREMRLLQINIMALTNMEYVDRFLESNDIDRLSDSLIKIQAEINPNLSNIAEYQNILNFINDIQSNMLYASDGAGVHVRTLIKIDLIEEQARRNMAIFMLALSGVIVVGLFIYQRASFVRRKDQQIRSFASLFVHMTRTRITGLNLFVKSLTQSATPDPEMVAAADRATEELSSINEGLLKIAYSGKPSRQEPLAATTETLLQNHGGDVRLDVTDDAGQALVPAPQFHLILDELVRNAQRAVAASGVTEPAITVRGHLARRSLLGRRLIIEVNDNGVGMRADILKEAKKPFFSTRAGAHVGLGLTGCAEMVKALRGKFRIKSTYGVGTSIQIVYPLS